MKVAALVLLAFLALGASAKPSAPALPASAASAALHATPNESQLVEHGSYVNRSGSVVHRPAHSKTGAAPDGATAQCRDGSYSFSQHRRGTCSHHGGVEQWL